METAISSDEDSDRSASLGVVRKKGTNIAAAMTKRERILTPQRSSRVSETEDPMSDGTETGHSSVEANIKKRRQKRYQEIEDLAVNIKQMDTVDLAVRMTEASQDVELVASNSGNLKGTHVKKLRMAARVVEIITEELHKRTKRATIMRPLPFHPTRSWLRLE